MVNWLKKNYLYTAEYMLQMSGYLSCCLVTFTFLLLLGNLLI